MRVLMILAIAAVAFLAGCDGPAPSPPSTPSGQPSVTLNTPAPGASQISGQAYNVDPASTKVVVYALTNQWYVQPFVTAPFTSISSNGWWQSSTNPWSALVVLLVNPSSYTPAATEITNPALDPGVLAWTIYPAGPVSLSFSGRTWGIKTTGTVSGDQFDPGPNFFSNDPSVAYVASDGLHLKISLISGQWQCGEVYLTGSLGYGTYTVQVNTRLDQLDRNTVAAPLFIYAAPGQELDNEYSGLGGLVSPPYNAQFVVQPYTVPGNITQYQQPTTSQFTSQMEWASDHVTFRAWNGWTASPTVNEIIYQWTYTNTNYIPKPGQERVHINLWLLNGQPPVSGTGDEMVINSFAFQPASQSQSQLPDVALATFPTDTRQVAEADLRNLRTLSNYPQIRQRLRGSEIQAYIDNLRAAGIEPERDIDHVILGWREEIPSSAETLGLASGRFNPETIRRYFATAGLPVIPYGGTDVYGLATAGAPSTLSLTFFDNSLLAFGRVADVEAMIDAKRGWARSLGASPHPLKWRRLFEGDWIYAGVDFLH